VIAAGAAAAVEAVGGMMTDLSPWYYGLRRPGWTPPDWLFAPAWTVIFALAALAAVSAWRRAPDHSARLRIIAFFALNGVLNILWSALFFRLHRPDWALIEVVFLWLSILLLILLTAPMSRTSAWLLAPYLAWVSFAAALNLAVVWLNHPFPAPA
jgi:tryptophan-rich sensory protein